MFGAWYDVEFRTFFPAARFISVDDLCLKIFNYVKLLDLSLPASIGILFAITSLADGREGEKKQMDIFDLSITLALGFRERGPFFADKERVRVETKSN